MISLDDVRSAAAVLDGIAHRTPVLTSRTLDESVGAQVFVKAEHLQRVGAFKFRGAYHAIHHLTPEQKARGVVAFSSGNHAQAVALAARMLGSPATIVMPHDAPAVKLEATRGYGAQVVGYDRYREDRLAIGQQLADEQGLTLIHPFDDEHVMAGQGTAALELMEQVDGLDVVVVCIGGGGLIAGCATALKGLDADVRVVGVEPDARSLVAASLAAGEPVTVPVPETIADGQQTPGLGSRTFAIIRERVDQTVTVDDGAIVAAMRLLFDRLKSVTEPSGASALAAVLAGRISELSGARVGVIVSGGNVGVDRFVDLMQRFAPQRSSSDRST